MRVVAGQARGRRLQAPPSRAGHEVRPTTDRVRESMFNALHSLDAIDGATVLDLFAGSGALGIEAWSRGAAHVTFVEQDRRTAGVLAANVASVGMGAAADIVGRAAEPYLAHDAGEFDLALLDPPYAYDAWPALFAALRARTIVVETDRDLVVPAPWGVVRSKWYGSTLVLIAVDDGDVV
jgi:16S rRNA (guanine966-N2)-methyltransferase